VSRIAVIGTGYVGLTTGVCLAHLGHDVTCIDVDPSKISRLRSGICPIVEDGLDRLLRDGLETGNLQFTVDAGRVADREFVFLCVPTPQGPDGAANMRYVETAARRIGPRLAPRAIVINKSTVPVGSTRVVADALGRHDDVSVVSNPEFLREGTAVRDFLHPDRVVIGAADPVAGQRVAALYLGLRSRILLTDPATAETIKYAANAFLATKLSFVNAVAAVCEAVGANADDVTVGMGLDRRIGAEFLRPGPGWGGSCFGKDTRALIRIAADAGYSFDLLDGAIAVNAAQLDRMVDKIETAVGGHLAGARVAALGLTFKAGTDDLRDSPAVEILTRVAARGARVRAYDPAVTGLALPGVELAADPYTAAAGADVLVALTEWDEFRRLDVDKLALTMATLQVVDTRGVLHRPAFEARGFTVQTVGRAPSAPVSVAAVVR
jgi:UDPglucose 6-dehydrogenase